VCNYQNILTWSWCLKSNGFTNEIVLNIKVKRCNGCWVGVGYTNWTNI